MTPYGLAKLHCANWKEGACLGALIEIVPAELTKDQRRFEVARTWDAKIPRCVPRAKCVLETNGVRCAYFEECVMPMGRANWPGLQTAKEHEEFDEAIRDYKRASNVASQPDRVCPRCGVNGLEPRKRFCYRCAEARKKEANRLRQAKSRKSGV